MASIITFNQLAISITMFLLITSCSGARDLSRLQNDGRGESECWTSLANIRSCSNEIVGFFLNGQSQVDKPCCLAILTIAQHCWPALIGSLGYSPDEVSFLQGYCEKAAFTPDDLTPTPTILPSPSPLAAFPLVY